MGVLCTTTTTTNNNNISGNNSSDLNIKNDVFSRIHRHLNYNAENVNLNKNKSSVTTPSLSSQMTGFNQHQIAEFNNTAIIRLGMHLSNSTKFSDPNCMDGNVNSCTNSYRLNLRHNNTNSTNIHSMTTTDSNRNGFNSNGNHQQQQQHSNNNVVRSDHQRNFPSKTSAPDLSLG